MQPAMRKKTNYWIKKNQNSQNYDITGKANPKQLKRIAQIRIKNKKQTYQLEIPC